MEADTTRVADGNTERWAAKLCARSANRASAGVRGASIRSRRRPSSTTTTTRRIAPSHFGDASSTQTRNNGSGQPFASICPGAQGPLAPDVLSPHPCGDGVGRVKAPAHRLGPDLKEGIGHGYRHHQDDCPHRGRYRLDDLQSAGET